MTAHSNDDSILATMAKKSLSPPCEKMMSLGLSGLPNCKDKQGTRLTYDMYLQEFCEEDYHLVFIKDP